MSYSIKIKEKAIALRRRGYSIKEVAKKLDTAKSTSSIWLKDIILSPQAQNRLKKRRILGQYKARLTQAKKREQQTLLYLNKAEFDLFKLKTSRELFKLCCALLFWCEGNKTTNMVRFTNSDPSLIQRFFLSMLRAGFNLDESKFRVLIHLHQYHDDKRQKRFWADVTNISLRQFYKSYQKGNTDKRKHDNYPGCIAISYYDTKVAKELMAIYNTFVLRGVG